MSCRPLIARVGVLLVTLLAAAGAAGQIEPLDEAGAPQRPARYKPPEHFIARDQSDEFLPQAEAFLAAHPDDGQAPRILLDMLIFAGSARNESAAKSAKARLLLEYPSSLGAGYVAHTTPAKELASLLKDRFRQDNPPLDRKTLSQFSRTAAGLWHENGPEFLDDELRAIAILSSPSSPSSPSARQIPQYLRRPDGDAAQTLMIALDSDRSAREKFVDLQALRKFGPARGYQAYLYHESLTDEDRARVDVRTTLAANLLKAGEFAKARLQLAELCAQTSDPRVHLCLAWTLATDGEVEQAIETLARLPSENAASPWMQSAQRLRHVLSALESSLTEQAAEIERVMAGLSEEPVEVLELRLASGADLEYRFEVFAQFDFPLDAIALIFRSASQPLLAYQSGPGDTRLFLAGEKVIRRFEGGGLCPLAQFTINLTEAGPPQVGFTFRTVPQGTGGLLKSVENLRRAMAANRALNGCAQRRSLMRLGAFPEPVQRDGDETILRWLKPQVDDPTFSSIEFRLTKDHRLSSVAVGDSWRVSDVRYGPRQSTRLTSPPWPDLPIAAVAELGAADGLRFVSELASLLERANANGAPRSAAKAAETAK